MNAVGLTVLSLILAFAVINRGGVWTRDWNLCLLAIALLTLVYRFRDRNGQAPPLDRRSQGLLLAFVALAAIQLLPLPVSWVHLLSPAPSPPPRRPRRLSRTPDAIRRVPARLSPRPRSCVALE